MAERLQELARLYAAGAVTWREIADELDDVAFGDLLLELARQGLHLPQASAPRTAAQQAAWDAVLQKAAEDMVDMGPTEWERDHAALKVWLAANRGKDVTIADDPELGAERRGQILRAAEREERIAAWEAFLDEMAARGTPAEHLEPVRALVREIYSGRYERDDGEITPQQLERIRALVREKHGAAMVLKSLFGDEGNGGDGPVVPFREFADRIQAVARGEAIMPKWAGTTVYATETARRAAMADDDAEFRRRFDELERKWWPALAAMAHEPDADQVPTRCAGEWLVIGPSKRYKGPALAVPGKWCVERRGEAADDLWRLVLGAVGIGKLYVAKASGTKRASFYGGRHLIAVYTPDSADLEDVRHARAVLRELGVRELLVYRDDNGEALRRE
jgi:hypothetical protein